VANFEGDNATILINIREQITAIEDGRPITVPCGWVKNYPNPFNPGTTLQFHLSKAGHLNITVYDVSGRKIKAIIDGYFPAGEFRMSWAGENSRGERVASGTYFARMTMGDFTAVRKIVLIR
jgi:hypothetical protein